MEPLRRISRFWNWLPAFRAVAETEHLPTAARELRISAPGLSRAIKLMEQDLGRKLFDRGARRIRLNTSGRLFLEQVRDAMRRIDDARRALEDQTFRGTIRVAASMSVGISYVLPVCERLRGEFPELLLDLRTMNESLVSQSLRKGAIDVALLEETEVAPDLSVERLATTTYGLYCGSSHPLAKKRTPTLDNCLRFPFVGPTAGARDAWPMNLRREIGLRVGSLALALDACEDGGFLALLPDGIAGARDLRRLPVGTMAETPVFVAYRKLLGGRDRVTVFLEMLRQIAAKTPSGRRRTR